MGRGKEGTLSINQATPNQEFFLTKQYWDHRFIKRIIRPMLGFKSFRCARILLAGIETMHQIRNGQMLNPPGQTPSATEQFYRLAC